MCLDLFFEFTGHYLGMSHVFNKLLNTWLGKPAVKPRFFIESSQQIIKQTKMIKEIKFKHKKKPFQRIIALFN